MGVELLLLLWIDIYILGPYHKTKCVDCNKDIEGSYYELDNNKDNVVCSKCYEKKHVKKCKEKIQGTYFTVEDKFVCANCYKKKHGNNDGKLVCHECDDEISGQIIRAIGLAFHSVCFKCSVCQKSLADKSVQFTSDAENKLYCQTDYNDKFAPKCYSCSLPIAPKDGETTAQRLTALDKDWHPDCFKCDDCALQLDSKKGVKCYPIDKTPFCIDCHHKR